MSAHTVKLEQCEVVIAAKVNKEKLSITAERARDILTRAKSDADAEADEKPQHEVTLSDYYIGQTEVTQELWTAVMGTTLEEERKKGGKGRVRRRVGTDSWAS